ncbi:MAG: ATP-grasp domain-containing protein [Actinomycetota bacterium]|nr:ATP-grasp domain-containing protein [Actinomycetota bacterium]
MGDLDLVAPLASAGVKCAVVAPPGDPARYSRKVDVVGWADPQEEPDALLELLLQYGFAQSAKPVLYFQSDEYALFVSRHRQELAAAYRVIVTDEALMVNLLDKLRFRGLADQLGLPVPRSQLLNPMSVGAWSEIDLTFPLLIKPASRSEKRWVDLEPARKAIRVDSVKDLEGLWSQLVTFGRSVLLQELVPGPETRIESYHTYVDEHGDVIAEFTGRKLRTKPMEFGRSTAIVITDASDIKELGRAITAKLELHGVAKLDFKRDADNALWLLEVNPRYTLWCHPAARAGVNIPALVWADLTGHSARQVSDFTPGIRWFSPWDLQAARLHGWSLSRWLMWAWRCETRSMMDWNDPQPFVRLCAQRVRRFRRRDRRR